MQNYREKDTLYIINFYDIYFMKIYKCEICNIYAIT